MRIHRGNKNHNNFPLSSSTTNLDSMRSNHQTSVISTSSVPSLDRKKRHSSKRKDKIIISVSYPSSDNIASPTMSITSSNRASINSSCSKEPIALKHSISSDSNVTNNPFKDHKTKSSKHSPNSSSKKAGKRNIKVQVRRFRMETKAAKTLAIIVGGFIFCWLPFFTIYLIRAFCEECIESLLFSILFWLGYCNSAVNPFIYALFSKDFRFAFKRVIYRCFCSKKYLEENKFHVLHRFVPFPFAATAPRTDFEIPR